MLRRILILVPIILLFLLALAFGAQNPTVVSVNFLVAKTDLSVAGLAAIFLPLDFHRSHFASAVWYKVANA